MGICQVPPGLFRVPRVGLGTRLGWSPYTINVYHSYLVLSRPLPPQSLFTPWNTWAVSMPQACPGPISNATSSKWSCKGSKKHWKCSPMSTLLAKLKCTANNRPMNHNWSLGIDLEENVALDMWMKFEAEDCAIVVNIKRAFQWCP